MFTSILGNKQSTITSYIYILFSFFFPFHIQKGLGRHKLSISTIIKLVHHSTFSLPQTRAGREQTLLQSQKEKQRIKKTKSGPVSLFDFHSSNWTNSLFSLFDAERSSKVFHLTSELQQVE